MIGAHAMGALGMRILLVLITTATALAGECPPTDGDCFQGQAIDAMKAADWAQAVTWWERAYAARPDAVFVFNLASTYDQWGGHCREALAAFDRYFAVCPPDAVCEQRAVAASRRDHITKKCHGTLRIDTVPTGAAISVDDEPRGESPIELKLVEGTYRVVARMGDARPVTQAARIAGGQDSEIVLRFPEPKVEAPPATEPTPVVVIKKPEPPPPREGLGAWKWTALGVGGAGLVTGIVFSITSAQAVDDEQTERDRGEDADRDRVLGFQDDAIRDPASRRLGLDRTALRPLADDRQPDVRR